MNEKPKRSDYGKKRKPETTTISFRVRVEFAEPIKQIVKQAIVRSTKAPSK